MEVFSGDDNPWTGPALYADGRLWLYATYTPLAALGFFASYKAVEYSFSPGPIAQPRFVSKIIASSHAILLSILAFFYLTGRLDYSLWNQLQIIPLGYCLYDFLLISCTDLYYNVERFTLAHHVVFAFFSIVVFPSHAIEVSHAYLSEITNPFLHFCYFCLHSKRTHTTAFRVAAVGLVVSFFFSRVVNFTYLCVLGVILGYGFPLYLCMFLTALNYWWFYKLLQKAKSQLGESVEESK
eukprot:gnl/Spiro4/4958_TR2470_c0_g1_i1.p1 gnl/Spiro4/4958_TR2470_c0_g1~~gnl/Spiro4/4958_TR2470_c0_g1_i1.p1  ORF type:complete len:249 (+),score=67.79 gnl/Spiro4/4958_TR2470_c0_g1_i1:31-747(+)